jgi:putative chitinase
MITKEVLQACIPLATKTNIDKFLQPINDTLVKFKIDTPKRIAAFLSQLAHESGSLRYVAEIASGVAYEGRKDLGNINPGDGVKFKGRGLIQITGRANYEAVGAALQYDFISHPEDLEKAGAAALSAGWFWNTRNLNQYADFGDEQSFLVISKRINGVNKATGLPNGWDDRLHRFEVCKKALNITI